MFRASRRRMFVDKLGRRYYTGITLVCCTFIVTYFFTKGTCVINIDNQSSIDANFQAINPRNIQEPGKHTNVKAVDNNQAERRLQKVRESIETGVNNKLQHNVEHIDNKAPMRDIQVETPVKQIAFLKVHKAGSSTIQNILFRFGIRNDLTFVLPKIGHYVYSTNGILPINTENQYDIFACHTIYTSDRFNMMPPGTRTLAIIREPLQRMISAAFYYRNVLNKPYLNKVPEDNLIHELINNHTVYDPDMFSRTRNSMGFDFGFPRSLTPNDTQMIEIYLSYLREHFELVLVMERFDESLVLMRREYHWSFRDIVYLKSNSHNHTEVNLTREEVQKFKAISYLDYKIYNMFYEIFITKIRALGSEFKQEVQYFRQILAEVNTFCESPGENSGLEIAESVWGDSFEVIYNECELMKLKDRQFVEKMKIRHNNMNG